jgi:hypothetical protein
MPTTVSVSCCGGNGAGDEEHGGDAGEKDEERIADVPGDVALQRFGG